MATCVTGPPEKSPVPANDPPLDALATNTLNDDAVGTTLPNASTSATT